VWLSGGAGPANHPDPLFGAPAVLALRAKIQVERDATIDIAAATPHMRAKDGKSRVVNVPAARGSLARPLTDREIEDKLRSLAAGWCATHNIQPLIDTIWALDRADDASLAVRLAGPAPNEVPRHPPPFLPPPD